ncbi:hypothetical protein C922_05689 [Plasmodium inui San Antonio 1]|uniref:Uncharacterized protein n=1 Tax=Plasmodium inui San Antonio 1 TaxID=1237626 RepID=W6ZXA0_9APIC|nr:hypothetical protein C922_05689 [Plasmodium inui San Antonio 1]EUD63933.1 hypothetical protein C922_05689 [Plasmodium inui San Antonio 1]
MEKYCQGTRNAQDGMTEVEENESTKWMGWLDHYVKEEKDKELKELYNRALRKTPLEDCGHSQFNGTIPPWDRIVTDIIDGLKDDKALGELPYFLEESGGSLKSSKFPDWQSLLRRKICQGGDALTEWMGALICIIKGLEEQEHDHQPPWNQLPDACSNFLRAISLDHHQRNDPGNTDGTRAGSVVTEKGSPIASEQDRTSVLTLVLSIYDALTRLCPLCGPYQLNNWVKDLPQLSNEQAILYCRVREKRLECNPKLPYEGNNKAHLLYRPSRGTDRKKIPDKDPPERAETSPIEDGRQLQDASKNRKPPQPSAKEAREVPSEDTDASRGTTDKGQTQGAYIAQHTSDQSLLAPATMKDQQAEQDHLARIPANSGLHQTETKESQKVGVWKHGQGSQPQEKPGEDFVEHGYGSLLPPSRRSKELTGTVVGFVGAMILGAAGIYGLWRIKYRRAGGTPRTRLISPKWVGYTRRTYVEGLGGLTPDQAEEDYPHQAGVTLNGTNRHSRPNLDSRQGTSGGQELMHYTDRGRQMRHAEEDITGPVELGVR